MKSGKNKAKPYLSAEAIQAKIQENPIVKLGDVVYAQIEDAILSSELAPGQKINITKLAETMGVSTTPVRDAVDRLCAKGFIVNRQGVDAKYSSYYIFDMSNDSLRDLYDARKAVECKAVYLCAQKNWNVDLDKLYQLALDFQSPLETYTYDRSVPWNRSDTAILDRQFHSLIVRSTGNIYLMEMYSIISKYLDYVSVRRSEFLKKERNPDSIKMLANQHMTIYNAVKLGFADMAISLMDEHISYCADHIVQNRQDIDP